MQAKAEAKKRTSWLYWGLGLVVVATVFVLAGTAASDPDAFTRALERGDRKGVV